MAPPKPVPGKIPLGGRIPAAHVPGGGRAPPAPRVPSADRRISFAFTYWKQRDGFGVGDVKGEWFVALLERLGAYSEKRVDEFRADRASQDTLRYHLVDWGQRGIEIRREDLDWLPPVYRDNPEEYEIYQFEVTSGLGRFAGFWDEDDVFQIVLLDREHNLQPSKKHNWTTRKTRIAHSPHASFLTRVHELAKSVRCECGTSAKLTKLVNDAIPDHVLIAHVDVELAKRVRICDFSITDLMAEVLRSLEEAPAVSGTSPSDDAELNADVCSDNAEKA